MALDPTMMPELPKPACTFADHSYPAFTAKQMHDYAEAAILSYLQHAGEGEPVAVAYQCREIGEGDWRGCTREQYEHFQSDPHHDTRIVTAPPAPAEPAEEEVKWRDLALQFDGHRIEALSLLRYVSESRNCVEATGRAHEVEAFLAKPPLSGEAVLARRIASLSTLTTDTPVAGDGANCSVPDGSIAVPVEKLLAIRDALAENEVNEAWHQLYSLADPAFRSMTPWAEWEHLAAAPQKGGE